MKEDQHALGVDALLLDVDSDKNNLGGGGGGNPLPPQPVGFIGFPQPPLLPQQPSDFQPFNYPVSIFSLHNAYCFLVKTIELQDYFNNWKSHWGLHKFIGCELNQLYTLNLLKQNMGKERENPD